jgi:hypothetical protein
MGGGASSGAGQWGTKKSYAPTQSTFKKNSGTGLGSYLENVSSSGPMESGNYVSAAPVGNNGNSQPAANTASYMEQMSGGGASAPKKSYAPSGGKPTGNQGGVPGSYLGQL